MKIFIVLLLFIVQLHAFDKETAAKIFNKLFIEITSTTPVYVYTREKEYKEVIKKSPNLYLVTDPKDSHIILLTHIKDVVPYTKKQILFSTSYAIFRQNTKVIGSFYWDKGRIKIEFIRSRLNNQNISLSKDFEQFIVDEI